MIQFISDAIAFIKSLSAIDFILYFAVLVLIVLVISLYYVMRTTELEKDDSFYQKEKLDDIIDLKSIAESIDTNPKPLIDMTNYESEQEEKAIISYEELLNTAKISPIAYDDEELVDDLVSVKKVNLEQLSNPIHATEEKEFHVKLFHYEREEAFLETLKQLNKLLN